MRARSVLIQRRKDLHPLVQGRAIHVHPTFGQLFCHVGITQAVAQVVAHGQGDHVGREPVAGERAVGQGREGPRAQGVLIDLIAAAISAILARLGLTTPRTHHDRFLLLARCSCAVAYRIPAHSNNTAYTVG